MRSPCANIADGWARRCLDQPTARGAGLSPRTPGDQLSVAGCGLRGSAVALGQAAKTWGLLVGVEGWRGRVSRMGHGPEGLSWSQARSLPLSQPRCDPPLHPSFFARAWA
jgi:hypothetical protein